MKRQTSQKRSNRGFTLLEAIVGLAVLGIAVLSMLALLSQHALVERRLDAHLGALRALEAHHEALRGSWVPDIEESLWQDARVKVKLETIQTPDEVDGFVVFAETEPLSPAGLYKVVLEARYTLGRQPFTQRLETRFWRG